MTASPPRAELVRGYALYLVAATFFAVNGTIAKSMLLTDFDAARLAQFRVTSAFLVLLVFVGLRRRSALRLRREELPLLLLYGILGVTMTQWLYFVAIELLPVGVALLIEFTAPIMVALWFQFAWRQPARKLVWVALVMALAGLALVAQVWQGFSLDALGVLAAVGAAISLAIYYLAGDRQLRVATPRDPVSLTMWGFGAATAFWAIFQPWWSFPWSEFTGEGQPLGPTGPAVPIWILAVYLVLLGTVIPFWLVLAAMRTLRASQASAVGMVEPILASIVAWVALGETMTAIQVVGAVVVLAGVTLAERSR